MGIVYHSTSKLSFTLKVEEDAMDEYIKVDTTVDIDEEHFEAKAQTRDKKTAIALALDRLASGLRGQKKE